MGELPGGGPTESVKRSYEETVSVGISAMFDMNSPYWETCAIGRLSDSTSPLESVLSYFDVSSLPFAKEHGPDDRRERRIFQ